MEEATGIVGRVAMLAVYIFGAMSVLSICYAGFLYMTAAGDPQKSGMARNALFGAIGGMIIVGVAFMVPRLISETVIEPSGGTSLASNSTVSCDEIFKNQLVRQQAAGSADRMSQVKVQVQQRQNECAAEVWDPTILGRGDVYPVAGTAHSWEGNTTTGVSDLPPGDGTAAAGTISKCHEDGRTDASDADRGSIGGLAVPRGLVRFTDATHPNVGSGRDGENNIILFFSANNDFRPSDGANCWMYVERFGSWVSGSQ